MNVGSLFSGIGGFDLGFERAGMRTVWFCEQDEFCQRVLAKHWPGVPCHPDVRALVADAERGRLVDTDGDQREHSSAGRRITADPERVVSEGDGERPLPVSVPSVDVLCGGFPCQDISLAGRGAGIDGSRSGLWAEFARLIGELRPRYVVVENVPAVTSRGLDRVLGDLAACGFDAEWDHLPASAFGAPHRRDRFWLVAYPADSGSRGEVLGGEAGGANGDGPPGGTCRSGRSVADPDGERSSGRWLPEGQRGQAVPHPARSGERGGWGALQPGSKWPVEPAVGRVAHGIPARVDRLRSLGNSLVPQIAEWIGRRLMAYENEQRPTA